jgi:hypothetical protein
MARLVRATCSSTCAATGGPDKPGHDASGTAGSIRIFLGVALARLSAFLNLAGRSRHRPEDIFMSDEQQRLIE